MPHGSPTQVQGDCNSGPQPSRIPGNIGTLNSKVMVWDHDPFWARPSQHNTFIFSKAMSEQLEERLPDIRFELGGAFLRPVFKHHDMFVCTRNENRRKLDGDNRTEREKSFEDSIDPSVDFVGSPESGVGAIAQSRLPGGKIFECDGGKSENQTSDGPCAVISGDETLVFSDATTGKSIFSHQVWKHVGSIFSSDILVHPSEYQLAFSQLQKASDDSITIEQFQSAPKWDYIEVADAGKLSIWPVMITKQSRDLHNSVHWTLEKWTPVWQGQDFYVTVRKGDKNTDDAQDPSDSSVMPKLVPPYQGKSDEGFLRYDLDASKGAGVVNQAFYVQPRAASSEENTLDQGTDNVEKEAFVAARKAFDWRFQTYILIEIGHGHKDHNYFIEIVKGRKPRFLHLGEEWDNKFRQVSGLIGDFGFVKKCRELSVYDGISTDQLFRQTDFRVSVRNHLGRIVVTFEGHEDNPWVINRLDNDPIKKDFSKKVTPMIVPASLMRLHGGNISCAINYTPMQFMPSSTIPFYDRQVDTHGADDKDIYLTFAQLGNSVKYHNPSVQSRFFNDSRFKYNKVGYSCDAYQTFEYLQNNLTRIKLYEEYPSQYNLIGKGYYQTFERDPETNKVVVDEDTELPKPPKNINGMIARNGVPSSIEVMNFREPHRRNFPLSMEEDIDSHYEWKDYAARWDVGITLKAGTMVMSPNRGSESLPITGDVNDAIFKHSITPIATSWSLMVLGGGKPIEGNVIPFDISPLVSTMRDSWSMEDFTSLNHEMQLDCYIPIESTSPSNPQNTLDDQINIFNLGRKLLSLHNKAFYLTISYWWDDGIGHRYVESNEINVAGEDPNTNDVLIQMTGVAYGGELKRSVNRLFMSFAVKDYMTVMSHQKIYNSPFFDGVQDVQAIYELGKLAGLADESIPLNTRVDRRPLGYLRKVLDDGDRIGDRTFTYNGEKSKSEIFDLPGSFSSLAEPSVKFQSGESYEGAMKQIAQKASKTIYFDRWGVLKLETTPAIAAAFASANTELDFTPVFDFVSSPIVRSGNVPDPGDGSTDNDFVFDPEKHAAHLVYNVLTYQRSVEECFNQITVLTASNNIKRADGSTTGGFLVGGYTFFDQIWNPAAEGFLGYRKPYYQQSGVFGGLEGLRNTIRQYAKFKFPPVIMSFETYGVPGLKALDIITLDGNLAYITEISHELDASNNRWWLNIRAEWLKPFKGELGFLETTQPSTSSDGE